MSLIDTSDEEICFIWSDAAIKSVLDISEGRGNETGKNAEVEYEMGYAGRPDR